jgi:hypothetical protein
MTILSWFVQGVESEQYRRDAAGAYDVSGFDLAQNLPDRDVYDLEPLVFIGLLRTSALSTADEVEMCPIILEAR